MQVPVRFFKQEQHKKKEAVSKGRLLLFLWTGYPPLLK